METKKISLQAKTRLVTGKKVKNLRKNGLIPAVLYGHGTDAQSLEMNAIEFKKAYDQAGTSTLIDLKIDEDKSIKVIAQEPQVHPVSYKPLHVDLYSVRMDEKIKTEVPLEFIGESDAVKNEDGTLITNRDNIEIECLPSDLIPFYEIDLSALKTFDDQITVADIKLPTTIEILTDSEEVIAFVEAPRSDEELAELEETSAADEEKEAIEQIAGEESTETEDGKKADDSSEDQESK